MIVILLRSLHDLWISRQQSLVRLGQLCQIRPIRNGHIVDHLLVEGEHRRRGACVGVAVLHRRQRHAVVGRVGPRLAGSPGARRAAKWGTAKLKALGFAGAEPAATGRVQRGTQRATVAFFTGPNGAMAVPPQALLFSKVLNTSDAWQLAGLGLVLMLATER